MSFLRHLAVARKLAAATQAQALAAHQFLEAGHDIRTVRELLGHRDVTTTMIHTHVLQRGRLGVRSPADKLLPGAALQD